MANPALGAILAMTAATISGTAWSGEPMPLRLIAEPVGTGVRLQVVGSSPVACEARYELEVAASAGGSRSVQRGSAKLKPGSDIVLATTTLGGNSSDGWSATLSVEACDGSHYKQVKSG